MTTSLQIRTNGNYVGELKNAGGTVIGKAGPGTMKESEQIFIPHGETVTFAERSATQAEIDTAKAEDDAAADAEDEAE